MKRMRYLVKAKVKPGKEKSLLEAIESGRLGQGSVAGDEYLDDMQKARRTDDGVCAWVEVCDARANSRLAPVTNAIFPFSSLLKKT